MADRSSPSMPLLNIRKQNSNKNCKLCFCSITNTRVLGITRISWRGEYRKNNTVKISGGNIAIRLLSKWLCTLSIINVMLFKQVFTCADSSASSGWLHHTGPADSWRPSSVRCSTTSLSSSLHSQRWNYSCFCCWMWPAGFVQLTECLLKNKLNIYPY